MMLKYLASPLTDRSRKVQRDRYESVCLIAANLVNQGHIVFSPIAHGYSISMLGDISGDWSKWALISEAMLMRSDFLWIVMIDGWQSSHEITQDVAIARRENIPILYLNPETYKLDNKPL